jgi:putative hydrolase of the HAD superfamily
VQRFLVTSGFRRLQESKVRALGIAHLFAEIHIDAIDEPDRKGKLRIFETILDRNGLRPEEALVVGDNADSEIEAGNRLWIKTVQVLRPGSDPCIQGSASHPDLWRS